MEYRHSINLFSLPDNVVKICPFDDHLGNGFAVLKDLLDKISWLQLGMIALLGIPSSFEKLSKSLKEPYS